MNKSIYSVAALVIAIAMLPLHVAHAQNVDLTRMELPATGTALSVPLRIFEAMPANENATGQLFIAGGGEAQLLLGAFENVDGITPAEQKRLVRQKNYPQANIDYAPLRRTWFVLSGTMDTRTFYHRVTFSCAGRLINSWAMLYPTARKAFYDNLIERMHASFRSGRGPRGDCTFENLDG